MNNETDKEIGKSHRPNSRSSIYLIESRRKLNSYALEELIARTGH